MTPHDAVAILSRRFAEKAADELKCARDIKAIVPRVAEVLARKFSRLSSAKERLFLANPNRLERYLRGLLDC